MKTKTTTLAPEVLRKTDAYWHAAKQEGTATTPFDMTVLNELDRFHLVMDTIDRLPQTGDKGICRKQQLKDKLIEHKQYLDKNGEDLPEIRDWKWKR
jgi:xylulose-5-phosphate/fructose-6-phosphate phosphoketolase